MLNLQKETHQECEGEQFIYIVSEECSRCVCLAARLSAGHTRITKGPGGKQRNIIRKRSGCRVMPLSSILDRTKVIPTLVPLGVAEFPDLSSVDLERTWN